MKHLDGDPVVLRRTGQRYAETAAAIRSAVSTLHRISDRGPMVSVAIDRVRRDAAHLAREISQAERRYAETGEALSEYATALQAAQADADRAIADREAAEAEKANAQSRARSVRSDIEDLPDDVPGGKRSSLDYALRSALGDVDDAAGDAASAQRRYDEAVADRDRAAQHAIGRIRDVVEGSGLNDSFWDDVGGVFHDVVDFLADALEAIVDAITAVLDAIAKILVTVLTVIAAVIVMGLIILAAVVLALIVLATLVLVLQAVLVLMVVAVLLGLGLVVVALAVLALVVTRVLVGLAVFVVGLGWLFAINLVVRGMDPVQALVQAAIPSLLLAFPELLAVIAWASGQETGTPGFVDRTAVEPGDNDSLEAMFEDLKEIDEAGHTAGDPSTNEESVVRIIPFVGPNGEIIYRVHIPSTQQWTPGGTSGNDVTSDIVAKMNQAQQTQLEKMVIDAMKQAGIQPGDHVMLSGWSLGGITAGNLASDPTFSSTYKVDAIAVAGSSVDDLAIPPHTRVLDVSHTTDPVPRTENPVAPSHADDPNRYKIDVPSPGGMDQLGHKADYYQQTVSEQVDKGGSAQGTAFLADDPQADDGVQIRDYFGTPATVDQNGNPIGAYDYAYTRGD
jgi:ABC-type multidrug transport system fused ATPase/permease subunit